MCGAAIAIAPHSSLVRRSKPVYVTLDCKCWLAHELHFSTVANRAMSLKTRQCIMKERPASRRLNLDVEGAVCAAKELRQGLGKMAREWHFTLGGK
jgi:hypothetical protein